MKIVVLAGGLSYERDVSLSSGAKIANALMTNGHEVICLDVYQSIQLYTSFAEGIRELGQKSYEYQVPKKAPDLAALIKEHGGRTQAIGEHVLDLCQLADVVFLALHGAIGEDGKIQALLDLYEIPYTGSNYAGSYLAMDKLVAKELVAFHDIPTPRWAVYDDHFKPAKYPVVVKPASNGSSIGVEIVEDDEAFSQAVSYIQSINDTALIEEKITGREFAVAILEGQALPVIEIIPNTGFYDYENKYQAGATTEITPAPLEEALTTQMQELALQAHHALRLGSYSRIDFLMNDKQELFFLEANSLPGMTPTSLMPQEAQAAGITYHELCEKIVQLAVKK